MEWTLADIKSKVRSLTGRPSTSQLSTAELLDHINEYYVNHFPYDTGGLRESETFFTIGLTSSDDGDYGLASNVLSIDPPLTLTDSDDVVYAVSLYTDKGLFFSLYPDDAHDEEDERDRPRGALLYGRDLYVRPKPDDSYTLKIPGRKGITSLSDDTDEPADHAWGLAICYGAARIIHMQDGETEEAAHMDVGLRSCLANIAVREVQQIPMSHRAAPSF